MLGFIRQSFKNDVRTLYNEKLKVNFLKTENVNSFKKSKSVLFDDYETRPVVLRLTEPIISLIRILQIERIDKKKIKKDTISILKYSLFQELYIQTSQNRLFATWYTDYFFVAHLKDPNSKVTFNIFGLQIFI